MSGAPERCPVCDALLAPGSERCSNCGKVFGEVNRCPSCHSIAPLQQVEGQRYQCSLCGARRSRAPGAALDGDFAQELSRRSMRDRVVSIVCWSVGGPAFAAGAVLVALGQGLFEGGIETVLTIVGAPLLAAGGVGMWLALRLGKAARALRARALDARLVLAAARQQRGVTAADAARALSLGTGEADAALTRLAKDGRVGLDVDDHGVVRYRVADAERDLLAAEAEAFDAERRQKS